MTAALFLGSALTLVAQAVQADPAPRWTVRADPGLCILGRFSSEPSSVLSIRTTPGSDSYSVSIAAPSLKKTAQFAPATLAFAPVRQNIVGYASTAKLADGSLVMSMQGIGPVLLEAIASADNLTITTKSGQSASASVARNAKAVQAFRSCVAEQLTEWGADPAQFAPGGRTPVALEDRENWLSHAQLMAVIAQTKLSDLDADFRIAVSPEGVVEGCRSINEATEKGVEKVACSAVLTKPLFTAAADPTGRRVRGIAAFHIRLARRPSG